MNGSTSTVPKPSPRWIFALSDLPTLKKFPVPLLRHRMQSNYGSVLTTVTSMEKSNTKENGGNAKNVEENIAAQGEQNVPPPSNSNEPQSLTTDGAQGVGESISPAVAKELAIFQAARVSQTVEAFEG